MATAMQHAERETHTLIAADKVEGTDVYNGQGEHLGHVHDVMLDKRSGRVAYAIMAFGGFLGIGEKYSPVPWTALTYDSRVGGYVVPYSKEILSSGPAFTEAELSDDDTSWREPVHTHYGAPPYWM